MPKLYHNGEPEGWRIPGKQDRKAERVDIPSAPAELASWLNERDVSPQAARPCNTAEELFEPELDAQLLGEKAKPKNPGHCDACGRSEAGTLKLQLGNDLDAFSEWLETRDLGDLWAIQRAAELIRERIRALGANVDGGGNA